MADANTFNPWKDKEPQNVVDFRYAVTHGERQRVLDMIQSGAIDVNLPDHNGRTALYFAGMSGQAEMIDLLCENGADILKANNFNETALTVATNVAKNPAAIETAQRRMAEAEERETWRHSERWTQRHIDETTVLQRNMPAAKKLKLKS